VGKIEHEVSLVGGRTTSGIVRVGCTVRRPIKERATFVHELLNHLASGGFAGAPRFLGVDTAGREILSYIPGYVPPELGSFSDNQLAAAARLLRRLHDLTLDCPLRDGYEVVCHGDASPCNCVFMHGMPVAFIDFDDAHPGSRTQDLGYASWLWIDIGNEDLSADLQGARIADFFRNYGLDSDCAIDSIILAQNALSKRTNSSAVRAWSDHCRAWVELHREALIAAITTRFNEAGRL
jgi:hypothetical protein